MPLFPRVLLASLLPVYDEELVKGPIATCLPVVLLLRTPHRPSFDPS